MPEGQRGRIAAAHHQALATGSHVQNGGLVRSSYSRVLSAGQRQNAGSVYRSGNLAKNDGSEEMLANSVFCRFLVSLR